MVAISMIITNGGYINDYYKWWLYQIFLQMVTISMIITNGGYIDDYYKWWLYQ